MRDERGANMKRKRHILAFFLAVCMICTNLSVQAAGALDLYAVWKVRVTLDAGEGVFTGGATDVRLVGGSWDNPEGLASRLIVAAGGGGGGSTSAAYSGDAGGLTGSTSRGNNGTVIVAGATQTAAGPLGGFGYGGSSSYAGGGGGGGYYGGGATAQTDMSGSGGSSYISGYAGCEARDDYVLTDTVMIAGSGANMPSWSGGVLSNGVRGDGYCRIVQYNG